MEFFIIGAGLSGGFGGISSYEVIEAEDISEANLQAYDEACEEYNNMAGMHGLRDIGDIMEEEECDVEDADYIYNEERESWVEYIAYPWSKEKAKELNGYHFNNPFENVTG